MREDARRRFTFGITIEDTSTRFWFASRSIVLASEPFDSALHVQVLNYRLSF